MDTKLYQAGQRCTEGREPAKMFAKHTSLALMGLNLFYREMIQTGSSTFVEDLEDELGQPTSRISVKAC